MSPAGALNVATRKTTVGKIDERVLAFTVGRDPVLDLVLAEWDCIGSAAHVTMLSRLKLPRPLFSARDRGRVIQGLLSIIRQIRGGTFRITREDQDVHLAVERILTSALGDLGKRIHTGRSRNDQVAVDLRLFAKDRLLELTEETVRLVRSLLTFAARHRRLPMVGRTHLQPAMPSSVGLWASAQAEGLLEDLELVEAAYGMNDRSPLGSAAGYGVPLDLDRRYTARLLGFEGAHNNVLYASQARGKCESVILSAVTQVMVTLSRLAEDLILFSMPEFGYFVLPDAYCTGSSIMPQKRNPDVLELVRAKTARMVGRTVGALGIVKALPSGYNRDLQESKEPFVDGLADALASVQLVRLIVEGMKPDVQRLRKAFTPDVFATDEAVRLVVGGMPFRDAYQQVKDHLAELKPAVLECSIRDREQLKSLRMMDVAGLADRARTRLRWVRSRRMRFHAAIARLLGVGYPDLVARQV
jgi:argininosuccinate lyase